MHERTLWASTAAPAEPAEPLTNQSNVDVAVIGAGYTGLTAAWHLARRGVRVVVLEASEIGSGASGVNAGFVVPNFARADPAAVVAKLGRERGEVLLRMVGQGADRVFDTIREQGISCQAEQVGWMHVAHSPAMLDTLRVRAERWQQLGQPVRILERDEARAMTGARFCVGALLDESGGMINPLSYVRGLARLVRQAGASIHEGVRVDAVERDGGSWRMAYEGGILRARRVLLCTNAFSSGVARRMVQSIIPLSVYQIATEPLDPALVSRIASRRHPVADTRANLFTYRLDRDNRLISGGMAIMPVRAEERMARMIAGRLARELYLPSIPPVAHVWKGTAAMTTDGLPRIFQFGPGFFGGIGCNGRGIALTAMLGEALADAASGRELTALPVPSGAPQKIPFHAFARATPSFAIARARWQDRKGFAAGNSSAKPGGRTSKVHPEKT